MRFRLLSLAELEILKDDFIKFLASNTVTASDWVNIKENKPKEALELIEMFSDIVMEKVYSKVVLLEKREKNSLLYFKFDGELMQILGISLNDQSVDFEQIDSIKIEAMENSKIEGFRSSKVLSKEQKPIEVHQLITAGAYMGKPALYQVLDKIIS